MSELKTLNDCLDVCHDFYACPEILKEEAIKWINKILEDNNYNSKDITWDNICLESDNLEYYFDLFSDHPDSEICPYLGMVYILLKFFNITEDDLK